MSEKIKEASEVEQQLNILNDMVSAHFNLISDLRNRLNPILGDKNAKDEGEGVPAMPLCPLSETIRSTRYKVEASNEDLKDIINRLRI